MTTPAPAARGDGRIYATLIAITLAARLALYLGCFAFMRHPVSTLLYASDGISYLRVARLLYGATPLAADVATYDSRVFLTWPVLFGWTRLFGHEIRGLFFLTVVAAAAAPCLMYAVTRSRRLALLMCLAPPAWLMHTTFPMSEGPCMVIALLSVLVLSRDRPVAAGLLAGLAVAARPFALALVAAEGWALRRRGWPAMARFAAAVLIAPLIECWLNVRLFGDAFHQVAVYAMPLAQLNVHPDAIAALGHPTGHWGAPFVSLVVTPLRIAVPWWKLAYIYANVVVVLAGSWRAWRTLRMPDATFVDRIFGIWLIGNTALSVCGGPYWGFFSFDRWSVWALPALLWPYRRVFEEHGLVTAATGGVSIGLVGWALSRFVW